MSQAPSSQFEGLANHYRSLGVSDVVLACFLPALEDLGVDTISEIEANQTLAVKAADSFDACVAADSETAAS